MPPTGRIFLTPGGSVLNLLASANNRPFLWARGGSMLSQIPVDFTKVKKENLNKEILRLAIIAELDAINLYEQMAALTDDADIKKVLLDIAREEKTHVGEFETMLLRFDAEQVKEHEHAKKEIKELTGK
jgi:rubrerythrin